MKLFSKHCCKSSSISDVSRFITHVQTCLARNQVNLPTNRAHSFPRAQIKAWARNFLCYRGQSERERAFYRNWTQEAKDFEKVWKSGFCIDYEQSLFFPGPSSRTRDIQMATRETEGTRRERHEKRLNLTKKRDCSQSSCCRLREYWPLIGWNYTGVTPAWGLRLCKTRLPWQVPPEWRIENLC